MIVRRMTRLTIAVLLMGDLLERWHTDCLDRLEGAGGRIEAVLLAAEQRRPQLRSPALRWYARRAGAGAGVTAEEFLVNVPRHEVEDLPRAGAPVWDVVLKLGLGPVPAAVDGAARLGVWCFEHELGPGALPFFDEVQRGEDVTRAALVAIAGGRPRVLEEGFFRTSRRSYAESRDLILDVIASWPARVYIAGPTGNRSGIAALPAAPRPSFLRYAARIARNRRRVLWERLFRHPQWNIGVIDLPVAKLLDSAAGVDDRIEWLPLRGRSVFLADPFGLERDGAVHVLCERFRYRESRGDVCAFELSSPRLEPALELSVHASYPCLVEDDAPGETYCVPETAAAGEIALYGADELPRRWSKEAVLVGGFPGVDPTVFRHEGRWWLFATRQGALEDVELWAWHAPSLRGPWSEHARNPVKTDVRGSRPGGRPFAHEGALYRPAQDCSRAYGWRVVIQRVVRLTPTEFAEEPTAILEASPRSPFPAGRHTLCPVGDRVLVDGRRDVFVWAALRAFLAIWARDLTARVRGHQKLSRSPSV